MSLPQMQIGDGTLGTALLTSVDVVQELNAHWWCTIVCRNTEDARVPIETLLGQSVEVKTTDEQGVQHIHFAGTIHDVELEYEVWGSYTATIIAVSDSYLMDVAAHKQYYAQKSLSDVANTMAGRDGVAVTVSASDTKPLNYVQYGETDFSFLHRISDDHGAWMRPGKGGLEIFDSFQAGTIVQWREEGGLTSFRLRGQRVNPSFSGSHYDHHAMASNVFQSVNKTPSMYDGGAQLHSAAQSASQKLPSGFEPQRGRAMTLDDYSTQLQAESERSLGSAVTGSGTSQNQKLKAGDTITIDGSLDGKGTYGLTRVTHHWTRQGYTNSFNCTPWKQYRSPSAPAPRSWYGVVPARVVDHNDPKKMGRLKVQFFWQEDGSTHWARSTSPHAGPGRGFMFMPEVGDEVAVTFEDGDPERPIILGSLWNGVQQAPRGDLFGGEIPDNDIKRVLTKSGNRLQFVDKPGKESAILATPNKLRIALLENTDEHGRSTILVHSEDGDICLSAPNGQVHIRSKFFTKETN